MVYYVNEHDLQGVRAAALPHTNTDTAKLSIFICTAIISNFNNRKVECGGINIHVFAI